MHIYHQMLIKNLHVEETTKGSGRHTHTSVKWDAYCLCQAISFPSGWHWHRCHSLYLVVEVQAVIGLLRQGLVRLQELQVEALDLLAEPFPSHTPELHLLQLQQVHRRQEDVLEGVVSAII